MATGRTGRLDRATSAVTALVVLGLVGAVLVALAQGGRSQTGWLPPDQRAPVPTPLAAAQITGIDVPRLALSSGDVIPLGLRDDHSLDVPSTASTVGWYERSASPGTVGPAVLAAHVNFRGDQGAFAKLADMRDGDEIQIHRDDATTAVFAVDRVGQYSKESFPTQSVYAPTPDGQVRLITCGGVFNRRTRSYEDNIVVYGHLASAYRAR